LARTQAWRKRTQTPATRRNEKLRQKYGITQPEFDAMLAAQGGCKCCGRTRKRMVVDHDHRTGAVRGILCSACNNGIGALGDTGDGLRRALAYLETHERGGFEPFTFVA
jgi:hypothetical protein